ncbi:aromatic aminobenezylarsenical efflux permease ArsG family transporter [Planctomycetota bacterium]
MLEFTVGLASALWLGILTSISPCPMATNIAAISYISRNVQSSKRVLLTGLLYTLGRTLTYSVLGVLLVSSLLNAPYVSLILQKYMNKIMGPVLILVGMFLVELISFNMGGGGISEKMQKRVERMGLFGAVLLGVVFALSFCPVSAALFFGSLISVAVKINSSILAPSIYGIGTALPVLVFSVIIVMGAQSLGKAFNIISKVEWWARRITGVIFILAGIYFCLVYIFKIL